MICSICGAENREDAKFCKSCGTNLGEASKEITIVTEPPTLNHFIINNRFKIIKKLGKGGMGEVLLAEDLKLKRKVAIKSILKTNLTDTNSKLRFLREAQAASQLDHTKICTIFEIYEEDDKDYIVMQYIDGLTLDQIIGVKRLGIEKILDISLQVCDAMMEAHSKDIIHRDIKPGNIIIDKKGEVKILDFGLAKFTREAAVKENGLVDSDLTQKGFVMGTISYFSPEHARGKDLDLRTDLFSFGVVMYEMIEGQNPFKVDEHIETLYNVLNKEIEFNRDVPEQLKIIIKKTLEKDRENRYENFSMLKKDLESFQKYYHQLEEEKSKLKATEIINVDEKEKLLEELQKTSDREDLGEMVDRIKQMKASTQKLEATRKWKVKYIMGLPILVMVFMLIVFFILNKEKKTMTVQDQQKFYIYLHPLENETKDQSLPQMVDYLLTESLNQFREFKIIDKDTAISIVESRIEDKIQGTQKEKVTDVNLLLDALSKDRSINLKYQLNGTIKEKFNTYTIEAYISFLDKKPSPAKIVASGPSKDSILKDQINMFSEGVYRQIFSKKGPQQAIKKIGKIYGENWQDFSHFYKGLLFFNKLENLKAENYFKKCSTLLASKYYLSQIYYFTGKREKAMDEINQIIPLIDKLTPAFQARVLSLEGRLKFKFNEEIKYLKKLLDESPFSKDILFELGDAYFYHANPRKAMEYFNRVLEADKNYSKALNHLGYCYSYIGEHNNALRAFNRYSDLDQTANSFDSLGDGYFFSGRLDYAKSMKESAVGQADEPLSYPYQTLADIYILKAEYKKANEELLKYQKLENTSSAKAYVLSKQALIQYENKAFPLALDLINQALKTHNTTDVTDNTSPELHWLKGMIRVKLSQIEESKKELQWLENIKVAYNLDPNNFKSAYKYLIHLKALIIEKEGNYELANQIFQDLLAMKDSLSFWITLYYYQFFHNEYVDFLIRNQKNEEALTEVNKCLEYNSNYIPSLWLKAQMMESSNQPEQANIIYKKIAELYGESEEENPKRLLLKEKLNKSI